MGANPIKESMLMWPIVVGRSPEEREEDGSTPSVSTVVSFHNLFLYCLGTQDVLAGMEGLRHHFGGHVRVSPSTLI